MAFFSGNSLSMQFVALFILIHKVCASVTFTSTPSEISLNKPVTITWDRVVVGNEGPGPIFMSIGLFAHRGTSYTTVSVLESYGKNGTFTWTPSTSNLLSADVTYAFGIQDSFLEIIYSPDVKFVAPIPTPTATPTPSATPTPKERANNTLVTSLASIASILFVISLIACCVWKRKQRQAATRFLVIELEEQGHGPQMIEEILISREQDRRNAKSIKKIERNTRR